MGSGDLLGGCILVRLKKAAFLRSRAAGAAFKKSARQAATAPTSCSRTRATRSGLEPREPHSRLSRARCRGSRLAARADKAF